MEIDARYSMTTPDKAWRAMVEAWDLIPEERIRQDIGRFRLALNTIITAKGGKIEVAQVGARGPGRCQGHRGGEDGAGGGH